MVDAAIGFVVPTFQPQVFLEVGVANAEEFVASAFDTKPEFLQGLDRVFSGPDVSSGDVGGSKLGDVVVDHGQERFSVFGLFEVVGRRGGQAFACGVVGVGKVVFGVDLVFEGVDGAFVEGVDVRVVGSAGGEFDVGDEEVQFASSFVGVFDPEDVDFGGTVRGEEAFVFVDDALGGCVVDVFGKGEGA